MRTDLHSHIRQPRPRSLPATARKLQSDPEGGFARNAVVQRINALIEQRCALTIRRLTDPAAEQC